MLESCLLSCTRLEVLVDALGNVVDLLLIEEGSGLCRPILRYSCILVACCSSPDHSLKNQAALCLSELRLQSAGSLQLVRVLVGLQQSDRAELLAMESSIGHRNNLWRSSPLRNTQLLV